MNQEAQRRGFSTEEKLEIFRRCFTGIGSAYGTYDPKTGRSWQVKQPVTDKVILDHLKGRRSYGVYLLDGDRIRALAVDFDDLDTTPALEFVKSANRHGLAAYIERSKCKGFHVWMFFEKEGVLASKARKIAHVILQGIGHPKVEVFPKQDTLNARSQFGNFVNAPLFGRLVPEGKTVFLSPRTLKPFKNQWALLSKVKRVSEEQLDSVLYGKSVDESTRDASKQAVSKRSFGLLPCARRILQEGVSDYQRVTCFRLVVHLRNIGFPRHLTVVALEEWASRNKPAEGRSILTESEVGDQVKAAYRNGYSSYGCEDPMINRFCEPTCPITLKRKNNSQSA